MILIQLFTKRPTTIMSTLEVIISVSVFNILISICLLFLSVSFLLIPLLSLSLSLLLLSYYLSLSFILSFSHSLSHFLSFLVSLLVSQINADTRLRRHSYYHSFLHLKKKSIFLLSFSILHFLSVSLMTIKDHFQSVLHNNFKTFPKYYVLINNAWNHEPYFLHENSTLTSRSGLRF